MVTIEKVRVKEENYFEIKFLLTCVKHSFLLKKNQNNGVNLILCLFSICPQTIFF